MNTGVNIISYVLVAILFLVIGFALGYAIFAKDNLTGVAEVPMLGGDSRVETAQSESDDAVSESEVTQSEAVTTVSADNLTEGQKALAKSLGIDPNNITITQEMIVCAEGKLGKQRVDEITNGATPSFSEGVSLAACYGG